MLRKHVGYGVQGETANRALCRPGGRCGYMYWEENRQARLELGLTMLYLISHAVADPVGGVVVGPSFVIALSQLELR